MVVRILPLDSSTDLSAYPSADTEFPDTSPAGLPLQWIVFLIRDSGEGMAPEKQGRLFTPFYQITDGQGKPSRAGGTGLGLVITKRIIEALGGKISFTSAPGKGTTFVVKLPFVIGGAAAPVGECAEAAAPAGVLCGPLRPVSVTKPVLVAVGHPSTRVRPR